MAIDLGPDGLTLGSTTINDWADASGTVKQIQSTTSTSRVAMSNTGSWVDLSGLSVSITPSSQSHKILVITSVCAGQGPGNPYAIWFRLVRSGTVIGVGSSSGSRARCSFAMVPIATYMDDDMGTAGTTFLDNPTTTSALTYKVQGSSRAVGNWSYNMSDDQQNAFAFGNGMSTITAIEVN